MWKARPPRSRTKKELNGPSTAHWHGNPVLVFGQKEWDHKYCDSIVRGIQNFHMDSKNWVDIAYNFLECPHGYTYEGRGFDVVNAANGTVAANRSSHAICAISGTGNPFKMEEKIGFKAAVAFIAERTDAPNVCVGHRDHKATECPGNERYSWVHAGMPVDAPPAPSPVLGGNIVSGANRAQGGHALVGVDGGVFCEDGAPYFGSLPEQNITPNAPISSLAWTLDGNGYWLMGEDGGVFAFGSADDSRGSYPGLPEEHRNDPNRVFVAIVALSNGGYRLVSQRKEYYDF